MAIATCTVLWQLALRGLHGPGSFLPDDLMNTWVHSIRVSWLQEFLNIFTIAEPLDRSTGALYYRSLFEIFHLDFLPYAILHDALLLVNNLLCFEVFVLLMPAGPALLAAIAIARLPMMTDVYYGLSTVYDILCAIFAWVAVLCWMRLARYPRSLGLFVLACLAYQLALAAKEMAVFALPLAVAYAIVHRGWRSLPIFLPATAQTLWYGYRKLIAPTAMANNSGYGWTFDPALFKANALWYVRWLTDFTLNEPADWQIFAVLLLTGAIVVSSRSLVVYASALSTALATFFVLGLFRRNLYIFYPVAPLFALLLLRPFEWLGRLEPASILAIALASALGQGIWCETRWTRYGEPIAAGMRPAESAIRRLKASSIHPSPSAVILVTRDPFPVQDYGVQMLLSLYFRDVGIIAVRAKFAEKGRSPDTILDLGALHPNHPATAFLPLPAQLEQTDFRDPGDLSAYVIFAKPSSKFHIVRDIIEGGPYRWTQAHPEVKVAVPDSANLHFRMKLQIVEKTWLQTGPVTISVRIGGRLLKSYRFIAPGPQTIDEPLPAGFPLPRGNVNIEIDSTPLWISPGDREKLGYLVSEVGFR